MVAWPPRRGELLLPPSRRVINARIGWPFPSSVRAPEKLRARLRFFCPSRQYSPGHVRRSAGLALPCGFACRQAARGRGGIRGRRGRVSQRRLCEGCARATRAGWGPAQEPGLLPLFSGRKSLLCRQLRPGAGGLRRVGQGARFAFRGPGALAGGRLPVDGGPAAGSRGRLPEGRGRQGRRCGGREIPDGRGASRGSARQGGQRGRGSRTRVPADPCRFSRAPARQRGGPAGRAAGSRVAR